MTGAAGIEIVGGIGALVLVGSAVLTQRRRGQPVGRYALIWTAILLGAFVVATLIGQRSPLA